MKNNYNYANVSYWVNNTADGKSGLIHADVRFLIEITKEQQRVKIYAQVNENDTKLSHLVVSTPLDSCRMFKGVQMTFFSRVMMENFLKSLDSNISCPFKKESHFHLRNQMYSDNLLPPTTFEKHFKYEGEFFGMIPGKKGWNFLYSLNVFGRYKK